MTKSARPSTLHLPGIPQVDFPTTDLSPQQCEVARKLANIEASRKVANKGLRNSFRAAKDVRQQRSGVGSPGQPPEAAPGLLQLP